MFLKLLLIENIKVVTKPLGDDALEGVRMKLMTPIPPLSPDRQPNEIVLDGFANSTT